MKKDYADRKPWLQVNEDHDDHWHYESALVHKGVVALLILLLVASVLTAVTYAAQPVLTISSQSLVDQSGEE
jgi:hypothetical protein